MRGNSLVIIASLCGGAGLLLALLLPLPVPSDMTLPAESIWLEVGTLPLPLASVDAAIYETDGVTYVYLVGGKQSDGAPSANITMVELRGPGSVGLGIVRPLPVPLYGHAAVVACRRLFVIGGWDGVRWHADVWSAAIGGNGALDQWRNEIGYPFPVAFHDAVVVNPDCATQGDKATIYVIGGQRLTASAAEVEHSLDVEQELTAPDRLAVDAFAEMYSTTNRVYYSTLVAGESSSSWRSAAAQLPRSLSRHAATVHGDTIIVTGGYDGKTVQSTAYLATVTNGDVGQWANSDLQQRVEYHQAVVFKNRLWIIGGRKNEKAYYADVLSAPIYSGQEPRLGFWARQNSLPRSQYRLAAFVDLEEKPGIYVGGGIHGENEYRSEIYRNIVTGITSLQLSSLPMGAVTAGQAITYVLHYQNGGVPIENVVITQTVPANTDAMMTQPTVVLGKLEADASGAVTYTVVASSSDIIVNNGVVIEWDYETTRYRLTSNAVWNEFRFYLPHVQKSEKSLFVANHDRSSLLHH